jgi:hypothetical protein
MKASHVWQLFRLPWSLFHWTELREKKFGTVNLFKLYEISDSATLILFCHQRLNLSRGLFCL